MSRRSRPYLVALARVMTLALVEGMRIPEPPLARVCASAPATLLHRAPLRVVLSANSANARDLSTPPSSASVAKGADAAAPAKLDLAGLKKEADRVLKRAEKKVQKARARSESCDERKAELLAQAEPSLDELDKLPNCDELRAALDEELARREELGSLVTLLAEVDGPGHSRYAEAVQLARRLEVNDHPPARPRPVPKRPKGPPAARGPRLPYRTFLSAGDAQIRVGRTASDNDELSCDPAHRDSDDWWMHAAGCPGSHVVIRVDTLGEAGGALPPEVEMDAAILAARYSKAPQSGKARVTLCKARQVSKPRGAKPGLVQLSGSVRTVVVDFRKERHRLERLEATLNTVPGASRQGQ